MTLNDGQTVDPSTATAGMRSTDLFFVIFPLNYLETIVSMTNSRIRVGSHSEPTSRELLRLDGDSVQIFDPCLCLEPKNCGAMLTLCAFDASCSVTGFIYVELK